MVCDLFFVSARISACVFASSRECSKCGDSLDSVALLKMQRDEIPFHFICALREMWGGERKKIAAHYLLMGHSGARCEGCILLRKQSDIKNCILILNVVLFLIRALRYWIAFKGERSDNTNLHNHLEIGRHFSPRAKCLNAFFTLINIQEMHTNQSDLLFVFAEMVKFFWLKRIRTYADNAFFLYTISL
jgi:hypothetical protein